MISLPTLPGLLLQADNSPSPDEFDRLLDELLLPILLIWLAVIVPVAFWLYRDAQRRGAKAVLWTTLWATVGWVGIPLGGLLVLGLYLMRRPKPTPEAAWPLGGALPQQTGTPPPPAYENPARTGGPALAMASVKCPRCRRVFEYERAPVGESHVKCPACGLEGTI